MQDSPVYSGIRVLLINMRKALFLCTLSMIASSVSLAATSGDVIEFRTDSPQLYKVVKGDTLWDISARFLEEPWLWPEIWQANPQIENPHLIYPGDLIETIYVDGVQMLTLRRGDALNTVKLSPEIRRERLVSPIPTISLDDINAYLSRNRIASVNEIDDAARLIGNERNLIYSAQGDVVFAKGSWNSQISEYDIIRPAREINNKGSDDAIAIETILVGSASVISSDANQATLLINQNFEEVSEGDLFLPKQSVRLDSMYFPTPPEFNVEAAIVDIEFGRTYGGVRDTVVINIGERDRAQVGHLLTLQKENQTIKDGRASYNFIGEKYGSVLIYQVFRDYSLGMVLSSDLPISINDRVITP